MRYVLRDEPAFFCDPEAVTDAVSDAARPVIEASSLVRAVPSYTFFADPVLTVALAGSTVRVPSFLTIFLKLLVTSLPPASVIL